MVVKAWKLCSVGHGWIESWTSRQGYIVGVKTYRKENCGPLTAFRSIEGLKEFWNRFGGRYNYWNACFECEVEESGDNYLWFGDDKKFLPAKEFDTLFCDSITLGRKIPVEEFREMIK